MSSIANLSSASTALPPISIHPHGHRRGPHVQSTDDSGSDTAAQVPAGAVQNLFGRLLRSLEQVIGVQLGTSTMAVMGTAATNAATVTATASSAHAAAAVAAAGLPAGSVSPQSPGALLQNYLNNLSQNPQANGLQMAKLAGSTLRVNA